MAFVLKNGYDVEYASSLLLYKNLLPTIQHINGKGVTDKFTKTNDIESIFNIDVMRPLALLPNFRRVGATNNGGWHNKKNEAWWNNATQSRHFSIPVDLVYDRGIPVTSVQDYSNPDNLKAIVMAQVVESAGLNINIITFAKQLEGFFRLRDNFAKSYTGTLADLTATDITTDEVANAVFPYDPAVVGATAKSPTRAFLSANSSLTKGVPEIGAFVVPANERQAFVTAEYDALMKLQYAQNASEASARILATGFINPFTGSPDARIDERTGLCGMFDGVDCFILNDVTKTFTYVALGILGTADDDDTDLVAVRGYLDTINGMIVYGGGTCRGIAGPYVEANQLYTGGVYIIPRMKVGVECLHGGTIKLIIDGGSGGANWGRSVVCAIMKAIKFTPIDGDVVTGAGLYDGFNDGTSN